MRISRLAPLLLALFACIARGTPLPEIMGVVNEVQGGNRTFAIDSYKRYLLDLPVNDGSRRGYTRNRVAQRDLVNTRKIIGDRLARSLRPAGGSVGEQRFLSDWPLGENIIGVLPGHGPNANRQYIISAHYDAWQNAGADDDASGVAGLLEAAHVLARHRFDATLVFVAFDQEELRGGGWGRGSRIYASRARRRGEDIAGMVSMDMIGFNYHAGGALQRTSGRARALKRTLHHSRSAPHHGLWPEYRGEGC